MGALRFCTSRSALLSGALPRNPATARRTAWRLEAPRSFHVRLHSSGKRALARSIEESSWKRCDCDPRALSARLCRLTVSCWLSSRDLGVEHSALRVGVTQVRKAGLVRIGANLQQPRWSSVGSSWPCLAQARVKQANDLGLVACRGTDTSNVAYISLLLPFIHRVFGIASLNSCCW